MFRIDCLVDWKRWASYQRRCNKRKLLVLFMMLLGDDKNKHIERRCWSLQWVSRREERGAYCTIFKKLAIKESSGFSEYMRMPHGKFNELLNIIGRSMQKKNTVMRNSTPPGERLALTLKVFSNWRKISIVVISISNWKNNHWRNCHGSLHKYT